MQHFKIDNWRIGDLESSIFDVTNRLYVSNEFDIKEVHYHQVRLYYQNKNSFKSNWQGLLKSTQKPHPALILNLHVWVMKHFHLA